MADERELMAPGDAVDEDITGHYLRHSSGVSAGAAEGSVRDWMRQYEASDKPPAGAEPGAIKLQEDVESEELPPLPKAKPVRRKTDEMGRPEPEEGSTAGGIMRSVGEIPRQAIGGVDDAVRHATQWADPLTDWLNENVADLRYDPVKSAKTGTGKAVRGVSEFLTGYIPFLKGLRLAGATGEIAPHVAAGMFADFATRDPAEGRLADLWNELKLPKNVLTDYLSSDPNDTEMEARFKNTLEGAGLGLAFDGVLLGARVLRAAKSVKGVKQDEEMILRQKYGEVTDETFKNLGDPKGPAFSTAARKLTKAEEKAGVLDPRALIRGRKGEPLPEDWSVYVNFARIDEPDQVKFVIGKMAESMKGHIDEATRGVITQKQTEKLAEEMGLTIPELLSRRKGTPLNAETSLAARQLWAASGEKLLALAKIANGPNAGPIDLFNFRKMMATHAAVQAEVIGARTETARALAAWKIPAGGGIEKARAIQQLMAASGDASNSKELARRLSILAENGADPALIGKFAQRGWGATSVDAIRELWVNGLLSSPKTHVVNISSNTGVVFQSIYERAAASVIRQVTGGEGVVPGEAMAMTYGMIESMKDAFRLSAKALKTGQTGWALNKVDLPRERSVSAEAFRMGHETTMGRAVDFLGSVANVPGRLLGAEDEFFKTIGYRMELHAQVLRQATTEGHKGAALTARRRELLLDPPEHIRINSADAALYNTFTNETGGIGKWVMSGRDNHSSMNPMWLILPFVRTPVNLARYAFERSPLAPFVGQWRADIAAGGARADLALARMSTGTAIMMVALDIADSGLCTGRLPVAPEKDIREGMQRQNIQPYSIKVGDRWYSYNRSDPFGMTVGFAADIAAAVRKGEIDEDDVDEWHEVTAMTIAAISQVAVSKTYMQGFSEFVEVLSDPQRHTKPYVEDLIASFTPLTALNYAVKNAVDPVMREAEGPMEAIQARIAGLSDNLPPRRTLWGDMVSTESGLGKVYDFASPVMSRTELDSPIDREIVRLGDGPQRITKKNSFDGVRVNMRQWPKVYDEYVRLAGNDLKDPGWGMGAKDYLNSVVTGKHPLSSTYQILSDDSRKQFITDAVSSYRAMAQQQILSDPKFRDFANHVQRLKEIHRDAQMPLLGVQQ